VVVTNGSIIRSGDTDRTVTLQRTSNVHYSDFGNYLITCTPSEVRELLEDVVTATSSIVSVPDDPPDNQLDEITVGARAGGGLGTSLQLLSLVVTEDVITDEEWEAYRAWTPARQIPTDQTLGLWGGVFDANVVAWWDAQDVLQLNTEFDGTGNFPFADGIIGSAPSTLELIQDKSGNGYGVSTTTGSPNFSRKGLFNDGARRGLITDVPVLEPARGDHACFVRIEYDSNGQSNQYIAGNHENFAGSFIRTDGSERLQFVFVGDTGNIAFLTEALVPGQIYDIVFGIDTEADEAYCYINGTKYSASLSGVTVNPAYSDASAAFGVAGRAASPSTREFAGYFQQCILLNRAATAEDVTRFSAWQSPAVTAFDSVPAGAIAWWDGQDVLQVQKDGTTDFPYPGDVVDEWIDKRGGLVASNNSTFLATFSTDGLDVRGADVNAYDVNDTVAAYFHQGEPGALFVNFVAGPVGSTQILLASNNSSSNSVGIDLLVLSTNTIRARITNGTGIPVLDVETTATVVEGAEYCVVLSFETTALRLYLNSALEAEDLAAAGSYSSDATSTNDLTLLERPSSNSPFTGIAKQIILLNRAVTEEEAAQFGAWTSPAARWKPTDIPNIQGWWDGTDRATMDQSALGTVGVPALGDDVDLWRDKALGRELTKRTGVGAPSWSENGLQFTGAEMLWDENGDALSWNEFLTLASSGGTAFVDVVRVSTAGNEFPLSTFGANGAPYYEIQMLGTGFNRFAFNTSVFVTNGNWELGVPNILAASSVNENGGTRVLYDSQQANPNTVNPSVETTGPDDVLALGSRQSGGDGLTGWIYQAVVYDRALTAAEIAQLAAWSVRSRPSFDMEAGLGAPDVVRTDTTDILSAQVGARDASIYAVADVTFDAVAPEGIIWEQGITNGSYLGVANGEIIARAGDGSAITSGVGLARVVSDATRFAGQRVLLHVTFSAPGTLKLWAQRADSDGNPVGPAWLLGEDTASADFNTNGFWAGSDSGAFTTQSGTGLVLGEAAGYDNDWNGVGHELRIYTGGTEAPASLPTT
jgi:hypothetical protein